MNDVNRVLQPLTEAEAAIAKLQDYQSTAELASAVRATHAAVQRSLRYLLRSDKGAPDDLRLAAMSPTEMAPDRLIPALRQRDLISLDLAGKLHELEQANGRAERDAVRAADADMALRVVDQLRTEMQVQGDRKMREVAHHAVEERAIHDVHTVRPAESRTPMRIIVIAVAALLLTAIGFLLARKSDTDKGIAQFDDRQYSAAEQTLHKVIEDNPGDARAAYYLAILYRRSARYDEAGTVLRRAIEKNPADPHLREEMGNLFMVADHPDLAVKQYRRAQELEPSNSRYWVKLVRAMRAAGDPEANVVEQQAPQEARAMLRTVQ
jgi:Flp pilus assembly protein TadD